MVECGAIHTPIIWGRSGDCVCEKCGEVVWEVCVCVEQCVYVCVCVSYVLSWVNIIGKKSLTVPETSTF